MPPHDNNTLGKSDPLRDNGRRNRSDSEEDAERSTSTSPPPLLTSPGSVPLPVMMFGHGSNRTGTAAPPHPPPAPPAMRIQGPAVPLRMDEVHAVLRHVLDMIDEDDFRDMDGPSNGGGSASSTGGSRGFNSFPSRSPSPSNDHYRAQ